MMRSSSSKTSSEISRSGLSPVDATQTGHERSDRPDHRDRAGALRGVRSDRVHQRADRPILQTVRDHHRHLDRHLRVQFADTFAGAVRCAARRIINAPKDWFARVMERVARLVFPSIQSRCSHGPAIKYSAGVGAVLRKSVIALVVYARAGVPDRLEFQQSANRLRARRRTNNISSPSRNCRMALRSTARKQ